MRLRRAIIGVLVAAGLAGAVTPAVMTATTASAAGHHVIQYGTHHME